MNLYVRRLAEELAGRGIEVDVFTRRTDGETPEIRPLTRAARVIHLSAGPRRRLPKSVLPLHVPAMVAALRAFVHREGATYDVLHSHYWLSGLAAIRYRAQMENPVPVIHMFHTLIKLKEFYLGEPDREDSVLRADGERCMIGRADAIVGATEAEAQEMATLYGRRPARYTVIPPGVDLELFRPLPREESRSALGLDGRRVVLFVGRQDQLKGLETLLRSVAALPAGVRSDTQLVVVGGHASRGHGAVPRTRRLVEDLGLSGLVHFRGRVAQTELPRYYSAADVCAVPSAYESFGMAALEAMACQTPVVAFRVGGLATTVLPGETGFLAQPGSVAAYTAALRAALTSGGLDALGRRARMAAQRYSWRRTTDRTIELYEQLSDECIAGRYSRYALP
jgi:D-inositol-3-phosphate glycosyltransferase